MWRGKHGGLLGLKADFEVVDKLLETGREHGRKYVFSRHARKLPIDCEGRTSFVGKVLRWTKGIEFQMWRAAVE